MNPYLVRLVINRPEGEAKSEDPFAAGPFEARWVESDGQMSKPFALEPPLSDGDAADLRWYLERYHEFVGAGTRARAHRVEGKLDVWGKALFDAIFGTVEGTHVLRNLTDAQREKRPILLTLGTQEPRVLVQPWDMMRDDRGPLAVRGVSIRRQLVGAKALEALELRLPLRVLLIVARPLDSGFIDPRTSVRPLLDGLDQLPRGSAEVEFCDPPILGELEKRISAANDADRPFHIVHFDGHGTYLPQTGVGALVFEKNDRKKDLVPARRLGDLMSIFGVPLVVLEACRTSDLSKQPVFGSVAPALLQSGVGSVVAFSHSIHIEASKLLVERFYLELVQGKSVGTALGKARLRLRAQPERWLRLGPDAPTVNLQDWFVPQLYQVGPDLSLLSDDSDVEEDATAAPVLVEHWEKRLHDFPPEPNYSFQGRAQELLDLGREFNKHKAIVISGMGGMGKTALSREAAAWWLRIGRFERAIFCSFEQVQSVDRAVQILGAAFEGLEFNQRSSEDQRARAIELFHQHPVLLVWDNFESTLLHFQDEDGQKKADEQNQAPGTFDAEERDRLRTFYRDLTQGKPTGRLLVTCRPLETGLPRIKKFALKGLAVHDSLHLVTAIADLEGFDLELWKVEDVKRLLAKLDHHPLSISLVAPHLAELSPREIQDGFAQLRVPLRFLQQSATRSRYCNYVDGDSTECF